MSKAHIFVFYSIVKSPNWNVNRRPLRHIQSICKNSKITKLECKFIFATSEITQDVIVKSPNWNVNKKMEYIQENENHYSKITKLECK